MVDHQQETCWILVRGAAAGRSDDREEFARRYLPIVRTYLQARWRGKPLAEDVEDVVQEVFIALFRDGSPLGRADSQAGGGFRALLHGVTRNVALHSERTRARRVKRVGETDCDPDLTPADDPSLSRVFDRAYAYAMVKQARSRMAHHAASLDEDARRRVELLRLRFEQGLPIRDIAAQWATDPARLHREYSKARNEFRKALVETVAESERLTAERAEEECVRLQSLLRS